jgi:hypothetical protein
MLKAGGGLAAAADGTAMQKSRTTCLLQQMGQYCSAHALISHYMPAAKFPRGLGLWVRV